MTQITEDQIASIVKRVAERLGKGPQNGENTPARQAIFNPPVGYPSSSITEMDDTYGIFDNIDSAVQAASRAFVDLNQLPLAVRGEIISSIRSTAMDEVENVAKMAVSETGLGRIEDKIKKNRLAIEKTPGTEILQPVTYTGDNGLTLVERAPYGVIGSITPCTNPFATLICNTIGMLAGGNAVVFNVHPTAKKISVYTVDMLNRAIVQAGGPKNLVTSITEPTIQSAQELMEHPLIKLLVVTGGPGVVKTAMNSGKKVIAAGPGNPPVVVDETADIHNAAKDIVNGASFDNNIVCIVEKEILAVASIADPLKSALKQNGCYELNPMQIRQMEKLLVQEPPSNDSHGIVNKKFVGKDARVILKEIGVNVGEEIRLVTAEVEERHPFVQMELLLPVIPLVRVSDVDTAIDKAKKMEHGFGHTAVMHSRNIDKLSRMAREINTSIFVKNGPSYAGLGFTGEGYASFTIASPTGEGLTNAIHFTRERRCTLKDRFRIV